LLGILYAALGAFTFSLNNVTMRRGVVTGSVLQGMALTVPIGGLSFLAMTIAFGQFDQLVMIPTVAMLWLAAQGVIHFVMGRYCNYRANQLMGVNLAAPVIQLQVPFAMIMAVATMHETFTALQAIGTALMLGGSFTTQSKAAKRKRAAAPLSAAITTTTVPAHERAAMALTRAKPAFQPQVFWGYIFAFAAAAFYGSSPLLAREAFLNAPGISTVAAGCLAYAAATLVFSLALLKPGSWQDITRTKRENLPWFLAAAVLVAISQALVYASLAIAPLMVVTPILQLSLVFRLFLSQWINPDHEVMNTAVLIGAFTAVLGSILVSLDTSALTAWLDLPAALAGFLRYRLAGG
jgi:drug/metabolite transporter (DMT)-like permease